MRYSLFSYDSLPAPTYSPYNKKYILELAIALSISTDGPSIFVTVEQYTLVGGPLTSWKPVQVQRVPYI